MKKIISIILAVVMIFSLTATVAFAADDASKPVKIIFLDDRGSVMKEINVAYGEDYTSQAPKDTYYDEGYKYSIFGWSSTHPAFSGTVLTKLPKVDSTDGITELTFKAVYDVEEVNTENVVGGVVDTLLGDNTSDLFSSFIQLIKEFFQKFIMYLMNFTA